MKTYKSKPVVVRNLFEPTTHNKIVEYVNNVVPLLPVQSDLHEPNSTARFGRRYANDLPFFAEIHHQLAEYASTMFGEKVKPSYNFLSMYETGGQCPLHIDRPQCRYTIDYLIRQEGSKSWPIRIADQMTDDQLADTQISFPETDGEHHEIVKNNKWTECLLKPNDAVCYSGTHAWHYRPTQSAGKADLVFFHFVPVSFDGSLQ